MNFYATQPLKRLDISPTGTMAKTELVQRRWEEPLMQRMNFEFTKTFSPKHEELPLSTDLKKFKRACIKDKEVLYEDGHLLIESQTAYSVKGDDRLIITLTYSNKSPFFYEDFAVTYKSVPGNF